MKKKQIITLKDKNIIFEYNNQKVQAIAFNPNDRRVEIIYLKEKKKDKIAFIHIPKNIKKTINPLE